MKHTSPNSKWLALVGSGGATLACSVGADAKLVQITQVGNLASTTVDNMSADLTRDGVPDINLSVFNRPGLDVRLLTALATASSGSVAMIHAGSNATVYGLNFYGPIGGSVTASDPHFGVSRKFTFSDTNWFGAATETVGIFEVKASYPGTNPTLTITRLIYDDEDPTGALLDSMIPTTESPAPLLGEATSVPEPSGLALLALGAGGLMLRRRRAKAAR